MMNSSASRIFAFELAVEFPSAKILGLDMSDAQYPDKMTWPNNVEFSLYNLLKPVPDYLIKRFDVIHLRLLAGGIRTQELSTAVQHLHAMLSELLEIKEDLLVVLMWRRAWRNGAVAGNIVANFSNGQS
jgi:hypothetical protein